MYAFLDIQNAFLLVYQTVHFDIIEKKPQQHEQQSKREYLQSKLVSIHSTFTRYPLANAHCTSRHVA